MDKRGSHVGFMLSFVIFIIFLIFLYAIVQPKVKIEKEKQTTLENLKINFIDELKEDLIIINIKSPEETGVNSTYECLKISKNEAGISGLSVMVKNRDNEIANFRISGDYIDFFHEKESFFRIYASSEEFKEGLFDIDGECNEAEIGSIRKEEFIFGAGIASLLEEYKEDYKGLKERLGVSQNDEFGFDFKSENKTVIGIKESGISGNIYSEIVPIEYMENDADIKKGEITIKVW